MTLKKKKITNFLAKWPHSNYVQDPCLSSLRGLNLVSICQLPGSMQELGSLSGAGPAATVTNIASLSQMSELVEPGGSGVQNSYKQSLN